MSTILLLSLTLMGAPVSCSPEVIWLVERSENMRAAIKSYHEGSSESFSMSSGPTEQPFRHVVYSFSQDNSLETTLAGSFDPDEIVGGVKQLNDAPVEWCFTRCCCTNNWIDHVDQVISQHPGQTIFLLVDCAAGFNDTINRRLVKQLENTRTELWIVKLWDSYCSTAGNQLNELRFAQYKLMLSSGWYKALWRMPFLTYKPDSSISHFTLACANSSLAVPTPDGRRVQTHLLYQGQPKTGTWKVRDPKGNIYSKNTHYVINDVDTGVKLMSVYSDCQLGWRFANGKCLYRESRRMNYEDAAENCRRLGAKLLTQFSDADLLDAGYFETKDEVESEQSNAIELDIGNVWLALDDSNQQRSLRWSLRRGYISETNLGYSRWAVGQPASSVLGARCTSVNRRNVWTVGYCKSLYQSVCVRAAKELDYPNADTTRYLPAGVWKVELDSYPSCALVSVSFK